MYSDLVLYCIHMSLTEQAVNARGADDAEMRRKEIGSVELWIVEVWRCGDVGMWSCGGW